MNINKNYLITLGISVLVMITLCVIVLMLMLPKQSSVAKGTINNYEQISKSDYTFEATKDISSEPLKKQYSITAEDMSGFKSTNQYKTGNTDPFAPVGEGSSGSSTTTNKTTTTQGTTSQAQTEATNKTTNSNGGVSNPPSTTK